MNSNYPRNPSLAASKTAKRWSFLWLKQTLVGILRSQGIRRLLLATPILAIMVSVPAVLPKLRSDPSRLRSRYEGLARTSLAADDLETAAVCLDRLTRLKNESRIQDAAFTFQLASLASKLKQAERAETLLSEAAPEDQPLYAPAHEARALQLLSDPSKDSPDDLARAETHLKFALQLQPDLPAANEVMGMMALQEKDLSRARAHLERASQSNPRLAYPVAVILRQQGLTEQASTWARTARDYFRQLVEQDADAHDARVGWAATELFLEDFETARTVLRQGLDRANLVEYHRLMANTYLAELNALKESGTAELADRLALIEQGLAHDPENPTLISLTADLLQGDGLEVEQFREKLRSQLTEGKAVATSHLLLGFDAWARDRTEEARVHWERALEAAPGSALIANNLAWLLATGPEPDLPRALELIELALDTAPTEPTFLSTQGRILTRMGKWREALAVLEAVLPVKSDSPDIHDDLAEVYDALGIPDQAEHHRRRSEELREMPLTTDR